VLQQLKRQGVLCYGGKQLLDVHRIAPYVPVPHAAAAATCRGQPC
jgi:hypothetical protein